MRQSRRCQSLDLSEYQSEEFEMDSSGKGICRSWHVMCWEDLRALEAMHCQAQSLSCKATARITGGSWFRKQFDGRIVKI